MNDETKRKYDFMKFELDKLNQIYSDSNSNRSISNIDAESIFKAFCSQCYHFKDWLIKEFPNIKQNIENFISSSKWLSICADFTNKDKHKELDRKPRHSKDVQHGNNHTLINLSGIGFLSKSKYEVKVGNKNIDSREIAQNAFKDWDQFLQENNLISK